MKRQTLLSVSEEGFHHLAYSEWGDADPDHPTIICVHGYSRNSHDFDTLANYLGNRGRHLFCPDIVGRGDSSWLKNAHHYNFIQYVADMNALIARTGAPQIDWIGTSMGGIIGMMLASLPNTPIQRLILNDVGPQIPVHALRKIAKFSAIGVEFKSIKEAKEYFKKAYAEFGILEEAHWDYLTAHSIEQTRSNAFRLKADPGILHPKTTLQTISEFFHHPHKSLVGILYDVDLWAIWRQIKCPVLIIHGVNSELLTPVIIKHMLRTHQHSEVYEIENAGHAPALLNPWEWEKIDLWLNS
jgi:pimeloyl-ACP methyl ester carboxylesterase